MSDYTTVILPDQRPGSAFFKDRDREPMMVKEEDDVISVTLDYTDALDSSETISTSSWASDGVTVNSSSNTTTAASAVVTGTNGELKNTVVTSDSRTLVRRLRFTSPDGGASKDYCP